MVNLLFNTIKIGTDIIEKIFWFSATWTLLNEKLYHWPQFVASRISVSIAVSNIYNYTINPDGSWIEWFNYTDIKLEHLIAGTNAQIRNLYLLKTFYSLGINLSLTGVMNTDKFTFLEYSHPESYSAFRDSTMNKTNNSKQLQIIEETQNTILSNPCIEKILNSNSQFIIICTKTPRLLNLIV